MSNNMNQDEITDFFKLIKIMNDLDAEYSKYKKDKCSDISDIVQEAVGFYNGLMIIRRDNQKWFNRSFHNCDRKTGHVSYLIEYKYRIYYLKYNPREHIFYILSQSILAIFIVVIMFPWASWI